MTQTILMQKATRIEGNANIAIEVDGDRLKSARFQVHEFRGFEKFISGRRVEYVPHLVSRICGLCSVAHQVASFQAIEAAMGIDTPAALKDLRRVMVLGEWISSHALSYYFLNLPDKLDTKGGIFELEQAHPEVVADAFELRNAGLKIVELLGGRDMHPISLGLGRFLKPPVPEDIAEIRALATRLRRKLLPVISKVATDWKPNGQILFPEDLNFHFMAYTGQDSNGAFRVFDRKGNRVDTFAADEIEERIAEMRVEWNLSKVPYLSKHGFPDGILLVGPLSRALMNDGFLSDPEIARITANRIPRSLLTKTLESYDMCRLFEMYWAAGKIEQLLYGISGIPAVEEPDWQARGQGIGILEAPRGLLIHKYLVNKGTIEKARLWVATQFNNAFINLFLTDLAQRHFEHGRVDKIGNHLIGRCIRLLDPCLSCATH